MIGKSPLVFWNPSMLWRVPLGILSECLLPDQLNWWGAVLEHLARYVFATRFVPGRVVLDVACGCGYGAAYLLSRGASRVVEGDISSEAIHSARRWLEKAPRLSFVLLDGVRLPFLSRSFDMVVSFETIEHLAAPAQFLGEVKRVLRPEGLFLCSTPNAEAGPTLDRPAFPYHSQEFTASQFHSLLGEHFSLMTSYGQLLHQQLPPLGIARLWSGFRGFLLRRGKPGLEMRLVFYPFGLNLSLRHPLGHP